MKFLMLLLTLVMMTALPACNAPPGAAAPPGLVAAQLDAAVPALPDLPVMVITPLAATELQAVPGAVDLTPPATLSLTILPRALGDLQIPHAQTMPGEALGRRDKAALARLCPTVSVSSAMLHGWQRSGPRHC